MNNYQVLFSGEIAEGAKEDVVRANLARALSIDDRKLTQLFSGRTVVLKSRLNQSQAEALQAHLSDLGAISRIKDLAPAEAKPSFKIDKREPGHTLKDLTAAHVACPRCGHMQLDAEFCARCGADITALQAQQRKEDLIIEKKIRELRRKNGTRPAPAADEQSAAFEAPDDVDDDTIPTPLSGGSKIKRWFKRR